MVTVSSPSSCRAPPMGDLMECSQGQLLIQPPLGRDDHFLLEPGAARLYDSDLISGSVVPSVGLKLPWASEYIKEKFAFTALMRASLAP